MIRDLLPANFVPLVQPRVSQPRRLLGNLSAMETACVTSIPAETEDEFEIGHQEEQPEVDSEEELPETPTDVKIPAHRSWVPTIYTYVSKESYMFAGYDITIHESTDHFGAVIWPGAVALCHFLENNWKEFDLNDKNVLELGAGTGLLSVVACLLGAYVTATDLSCTIGNLQSNLMRNTRNRSKHQPQVKELAWNVDLDKNFPHSDVHYDYILAADVVYHHDYLAELLVTLDYFCQRSCVILWANKLRFESDYEFLEKFKLTFDTFVLVEDTNSEIVIIKGIRKCNNKP
ncbi:protein-lysine methyltransferase METTL21C-like [Leucoraja erinacea]|uniref:protein-lysine methyltransferase METTL21C-like n=1 Tax=Leucoraja erinaceus TaxID=7782 RepID=UPI002456325C|nr:protein-lysine methyltransferase METTL21C-like [Leucoraja erinacea]